MSRKALRVGVVGCGLIGNKRADALGAEDELVGCTDASESASASFAAEHRTRAFANIDQLLECSPDVVVIAVSHDSLAPLAETALEAGAHVLVEKPAGLGVRQIERLSALEQATGKRVKVGFNHRFHGGLQRAAAEVHSSAHGELMHIRGRYGHGGRLGYDREWRADPRRSGGGELIDQGMHLLDLTHWIAGPLPLHSALLRTQFWDAPVEDNAALLLGDGASRESPWATLHVSWTEWKNLFSLEVYCRTAKLHVEGLARSYGPQRLRIYRMGPELGPPEVEVIDYPPEDGSWAAEWEHFAAALSAADGRPLSGDLEAAGYAWTQVEAAYALSPAFALMRDTVRV
ncbi:MAG TPA: Gfo/Idh/MocA family oxidoreductase [Solirubrobacteraceae bacterium]|jgi:predicted dehydrogenase|nr:Gfo/Idh/MocA family oxidoreductase [Solirubrobacteraceae bacterium]